jgi:hypothetical protein
MMALLLLTLVAADPCETPATVPAIPMARDFHCPPGAEAFDKGEGLVACRRSDGLETGDVMYRKGKSGSVFHPSGLNIGWEGEMVRFFRTEKSGMPVGAWVVRDGAGRVTRYEMRDEGSQLVCGRYYEGGRLTRRADGDKWTWLDEKGQPLKLSEPLKAAEILAVVNEHRDEAQLCYEQRLKEVSGELRGEVTVEFEVKDGAVTQAELKGDRLHDAGVTDCLMARIKSWAFRPSTEAANVAFPFVFKPAKEGK